MTSRNHLISVIIPIYNADKYIGRCLESVIGQDYSNLEIILVDDGSTDGSAAICDSWKAIYPNKIKVIRQHNQGASIARKIGIAAAAGDFLTFVDSDDYVLPNYVSALYHAAVANDAPVAVCPFCKIVTEKKVYATEYSLANNRILDKEELFRRFFKYEFWAFWGGIYCKDMFDGIIYPNATINEDYFVKAQLFSKASRIGYSPYPLYVYEAHPGSLSNLKLSVRALGEFDNTIATWKYISEAMPKYSKHALAIASEAACKWLRAMNKLQIKENRAYADYRLRIIKFISRNLSSILLNNHLLWKIRLVLLYEYIRSRSAAINQVISKA